MAGPNPTTTEWVPLNTVVAGGGSGETDLDYKGDYVPATYNDGDIVIASDGVAYLCVKKGTTTPPEPWPGGGIANHHTTHEPGGSDALVNAAWASQPNTFTQPQTFNDAIITTAADGLIRPDTVDGADTKGVIVCGGGAAAGARGAYIWVRGNENAYEPGGITLAAPKTVITGDVHEKTRTVPMGHWIAVPFNAANFWIAQGTWQIATEHVLSNRYTLIGKTCIWNLNISGSTFVNPWYYGTVQMPSGITAAASGMAATAQVVNNSKNVPTHFQWGAGANVMTMVMETGLAWAPGNFSLQAMIFIEIP
jgi:hypothetical protein